MYRIDVRNPLLSTIVIKNKAYRAWRPISDSILMVRKTKHKFQLVHETTVLRSPKLVEK